MLDKINVINGLCHLINYVSKIANDLQDPLNAILLAQTELLHT